MSLTLFFSLSLLHKLVHVFVKTKPGTESAFKEASLENARASSLEEGIARFDVLQDKEDATQFVLVEVYKNSQAPAKHKETEHYAVWRDNVADMMAEPRQARKFENLFPATVQGWDYPENTELE
jgi:autoinducer 2-degrading protein